MSQTEIRRLYRSRSNRMIAGVAGGLGEFLGLDPTIVRLLFVFSLFLSGVGLLVYVVMLLVVPEEPLPQTPAAPERMAADTSGDAPKPKRKTATKKSGEG